MATATRRKATRQSSGASKAPTIRDIIDRMVLNPRGDKPCTADEALEKYPEAIELVGNEMKWVAKLQVQESLPKDGRDWLFWTEGGGCGVILQATPDILFPSEANLPHYHIGCFRYEGEHPTTLDIVKALVKTCRIYRPESVWVQVHLAKGMSRLEKILPAVWGIRLLYCKQV